MELNYLQDEKNVIEFEIHGVSHGFCNLLKEELGKDKSVELVTYRVDHPLIPVPVMLIEGKNPKASLKKAVDSLKVAVADFKKQAKKI